MKPERRFGLPSPRRAFYLLLSGISSIGALAALTAQRLRRGKGTRIAPAPATGLRPLRTGPAPQVAVTPTTLSGFATMAILSGDTQMLERCAAEVTGFPGGIDEGSGRSWLRTAMDLGATPALAWIARQGVDLEARGHDGLTALEAAIMREDEAARDVIRVLLDAGAEVNAIGPTEETPLHLAAAAGDEAVVRLLLERGADPAAPDGESDPRTPADVAEECGHDGIAALLRSLTAQAMA